MKNDIEYLRYHWRTIFSLATLLVDLASIFTCGYVVQIFLVRYYAGPVLLMNEALILPLTFFPIWLLFSLLLGVYRHAYFTNSSFHVLLAAKAYVYASSSMLALLFFLNTNNPRSLLSLFLLLLPPFFALGRVLMRVLNRLFMHYGLGIRNVLMVMSKTPGNTLPFSAHLFKSFGYNIMSIVYQTKSADNGEDEELSKLPSIQMSELEDYLSSHLIDNMFIISEQVITDGFNDLIQLCHKNRVRLKLISPSTLSVLRMARVFDIAGITLYAPPRKRTRILKSATKRVFDIAGSLILLFLLSPLIMITCIAIFLETGKPIFYGQKRASLKNRNDFIFYKFRSMIKNAEGVRDQYAHRNESSGGLFKMKNDPRITKFGRYLRKFSIDELPQLINVLKGDMSLVGPRPLPIDDFERAKLDPGFWAAISARADVRPGITGLWQISGRSNIDFHDMILLDLYYIEYQSVLFDLEILFETIPAVLISRGAF